MMGKMMKTVLSKLRRDETGQAFILVLILLVVGALIIAPLLGFMGTGLIAGQLNEKRMAELYAADAGVELAIWQLTIGGLTVDEGTPETLNPSPMNDETVDTVVVTIENQSNAVYKITSVATTDADSSTTVVSYLSSLDLSSFLDNAITSGGDVTIKPEGTPVEEVVPEGEVVEDYSGDWPTAEQISAFYKSQVDTSDPYLAATLDLDGVSASIESEYIEGEFDIYNSDNTEATLTLNGTLYITGKTVLGGQKEWTLDLNGNTIFVESNATGGGASGTALIIGGKVTLTGSGVIIAVGDVFFSPNIDSNPDNFIFIMSVDGTTQFNPSTDFYGSIAGKVEVQLQPDTRINWRTLEEDEDFNWPSGNIEMLEIKTWEIDPPD